MILRFPMWMYPYHRKLSPVLHALRSAGRISACGLYSLDDLATTLDQEWEHLPTCGKCREYWTVRGQRIDEYVDPR
jgi:hypothetical protein